MRSGGFICDDCPSSSTTKATLSRSYDATTLNKVDITQDDFTLQLKISHYTPLRLRRPESELGANATNSRKTIW